MTSTYAEAPPITNSLVVDLLSGPGELQVGEQIDQPYIAPRQSNKSPAKVTALPEFVIYADHSVGGDPNKASSVIAAWKAMHDQYEAYYRVAERLRGSSDLKADLRTQQGLFQRAAEGENIFQLPATDYSAVQPIYRTLGRELKGVLRCVSRVRDNPTLMCVESYIARIDSSRKKYAGATR